MSDNNRKIVIAGAGIAGLVIADLLSRSGQKVVLIEKEGAVGGLARSFRYEGHTFDIGPHRFYSDKPEIISYILDVLGNDYLRIPRKSGVWMFGRYYDWPLTASSLLRMPLQTMMSSGLDLVIRKKGAESNFEEYIISQYGRTLYEIFFRPYTEKFLGVPCHEISREWALAGIDRAVIDKRISISGLPSLLKSILRPIPPLRFIYPKGGGIGVFAEQLRKRILDNGGALMLNSGVTGVVVRDRWVTKAVTTEGEHDCDLLIWTGPVTSLRHLIMPAADKSGLEYLSLLLFNYRIAGPVPVKYQWCYYGSQDIPFNRISVPSLFDPRLSPHGETGLCVEVTCRRGDEVWNQPKEIEVRVREKMLGLGLAKEKRNILGCTVERIESAYPVYRLGYEDRLHLAAHDLGDIENLKLIGRTGRFRYNNMDDSIEEALAVFQEICPSATNKYKSSADMEV